MIWFNRRCGDEAEDAFVQRGEDGCFAEFKGFNVVRMKSVHVFFGIHCCDECICVVANGERDLDEDACDVWIVVPVF